jgi:hypothetical protein
MCQLQRMRGTATQGRCLLRVSVGRGAVGRGIRGRETEDEPLRQ